MKYTSTKILPYVYKLTNKETGQFYFGYRYTNKVPSSEDMGTYYFTSGEITKNDFHSFEWEILAEFYNSDDAYWFEQDLIYENRKHPLILNKSWRKNGTHKFIRSGPHSEESKKKMILGCSKRPKASEETRRKIGEAVSKRIISDATREKLSRAQRGKKLSEEQKKKIGEKSKGRVHSAETKKKISDAGKGRTYDMSNETKKLLSLAHIGKKLSEETKKKISEGGRGKKRSEETKEKMRNAWKNRKSQG